MRASASPMLPFEKADHPIEIWNAAEFAPADSARIAVSCASRNRPQAYKVDARAASNMWLSGPAAIARSISASEAA
jgi:hypothetical protein